MRAALADAEWNKDGRFPRSLAQIADHRTLAGKSQTVIPPGLQARAKGVV